MAEVDDPFQKKPKIDRTIYNSKADQRQARID